jgi:hypothetical protein
MGITASRRSRECPVDALAEEAAGDRPTITDAPPNRTDAEVSAWMGGCDLEMRRGEQGRRGHGLTGGGIDLGETFLEVRRKIRQ